MPQPARGPPTGPRTPLRAQGPGALGPPGRSWGQGGRWAYLRRPDPRPEDALGPGAKGGPPPVLGTRGEVGEGSGG